MSKVIGVICAFMCTFSIAGDLVQRPFIGKFVNYNLQHPENKEVTRVYMSEFGVRVESDGMFGAEAGGYYVKNQMSNRAWLVRPSRKMYAELPEQSDQEHTGVSEGFMANKPCLESGAELRSKHVVGIVTMLGVPVVVWECEYTAIKARQYFSEHWGLVIKEELPNQMVTEFQSIQEASWSEDFFKPSTLYTEVNLEDVVFMRPLLEGYAE